MIKNVLSIAGSDPSGGAGIQADIKTFSACGVYAMSVITSLTAQNTRGVNGVHAVPHSFVVDQVEAIFADVRVDAIKIGMIGNDSIATAIAATLARHRNVPIILDPVMMAKGGSPLLSPDGITAVREQLLPLATILTPNLPEAASLLGEKEATSREAMADQVVRLRKMGPANVLLKGGHLGGHTSPDVLATATGTFWFEDDRIATKNTHGTGCTLSSAIAAETAKGEAIKDAVQRAKTFISAALAAAEQLSVGSGNGPVHHFTHLWRRVE